MDLCGAEMRDKFPLWNGGAPERPTIEEHAEEYLAWNRRQPPSKRHTDFKSGLRNWLRKDYHKAKMSAAADARRGDHSGHMASENIDIERTREIAGRINKAGEEAHSEHGRQAAQEGFALLRRAVTKKSADT